MAEETLLPSADSVNNWDAGTFADVNQGVDTPNDGLTMSDTSNEGEIVTFDMDDSALADGDTITNVTIRTRAQRGSNNGDSLGLDLLIGGSVQGSQVNRTLTTGLDDVNSNDVGWNVDWTAAQLDSLQVRLTTRQTGMPGVVDITVSEVEVLITYTAGSTALTSDGTPSIAEITANGVSKIIKPSTGTPSTEEITAAGVANLSPKVYLNTSQTLSGATELTVTAYNAAGTSITFDDPVGAPTGALFLGVENNNLGGGDSNTGWIAVTVNAIKSASGTPSIEEITASGTSKKIQKASGTPSIAEITASGISTIIKKATGTVVVAAVVASGVAALIGDVLTSDGTPSIEEITASGVSTIIKKSNGAFNLDEITAVGQSTQTLKPSGSPSLLEIEAVGVSKIIKKSDGSLTLEEIEAAGTSTQTLKPSGTPSIEEIMASGESGFLRDSTGAITLPEIAVSGVST